MKKTPFFNAKLLAMFLITGITMIFCVIPKVTVAETNNIFVEDYAQILSNQDKNAIKEMNEQNFSNLPGSPQYVLITLKNLDGYDSIEDYAEKKFQQLGIGDKDLDNGFLFVISIDDQKYRLETGYGVEDVITDSMKRDVVTDQMEELLEDGQYEQAVMGISKNIQSLVTEKYTDMDAAKEFIKKEKERNAFVIRLVLFIVMAIILLIILGILYYLMKIKRIQNMINKKYIQKNVMVFVYQDKELPLFRPSKGTEKVNLTHHLAKMIVRKPKFKTIFSNDENAKEWIAQYLLIDGIIEGWRNSKELKTYDISIYLEAKYLKSFKESHLSECQSFDYPISSNPYLSQELFFEISQYLNDTFSKHAEALRISKENKRYVERVCELFLNQKKVHLKKLDYQLELALMVYYFLQEQDLSDPKLLRKIQIDDQTLSESYYFANKKRKKIASENRRKALDDLTNMTLANYYLEAMIWSSYNSSQSSSFGGRGGGGSSFGGGSSGGGGFSGGW